MNETMADVIDFRKKRAMETFEEANILAKAGNWYGVINRLYYACFYIVSALLFKNDFFSKTHTGTKALFFNEFIRTGIVDNKWSEHYQRLFNLRTKGDYEDLVKFDEEEIKPLIAETENFLTEIKTILDTK